MMTTTPLYLCDKDLEFFSVISCLSTNIVLNNLTIGFIQGHFSVDIYVSSMNIQLEQLGFHHDHIKGLANYVPNHYDMFIDMNSLIGDYVEDVTLTDFIKIYMYKQRITESFPF